MKDIIARTFIGGFALLISGSLILGFFIMMDREWFASMVGIAAIIGVLIVLAYILGEALVRTK